MIIVAEESPRQHEAIGLLRKSVAFIRLLYPEERNHTFKLEELTTNGSRFFMVRHAGNPIGCGAYIWRTYNEIELKHMFVDSLSRGLGCGRLLLAHIEQCAINDGARRVMLETSKKQREAIGLYQAFGYTICAPYTEHHSEDIFMEKIIG